MYLVAKPMNVKRGDAFFSVDVLMCLTREAFVRDEETYLVHL